jgi:hypothetical protein
MLLVWCIEISYVVIVGCSGGSVGVGVLVAISTLDKFLGTADFVCCDL